MDYPEHIRLATRLGLRIRQKALTINHRMNDNPTLNGACGVCSYWLWRTLQELRPGDFMLVEGHVGFLGHCWVEDAGGWVVDPTATQFFANCAEVEVMTSFTAFHTRRYREEYRGRDVILRFPDWFQHLRPSTYRREFLPFVKELVQEEMA